MFFPRRLHPSPFFLASWREKTAGLQPYLKKECFFFLNKNFGYKINNLKGVSHVRFIVMNCEIEPLIVSQGVGIILDKQYIFLNFLQFINTMQISALEFRIEGESSWPDL